VRKTWLKEQILLGMVDFCGKGECV